LLLLSVAFFCFPLLAVAQSPAERVLNLEDSVKLAVLNNA